MKMGQCKKKNLMNKSPWHVPTKKWMTKNSPKRELWLKKGTQHKKTIQKVGTISLTLHKALKRWFFKRWC
jgi:hypothetical protein